MDVERIRKFIADADQQEITLPLESETDRELIEDAGSWFSQMLMEEDIQCTCAHNTFEFTLTK